MPVYTLPASTRSAASFSVCDKRDDINRVEVPAERLRQWCCGAEAVGAFLAQSLGLRADNQRKAGAGLWELGLVTGKKRSQMACLRVGERLELVAGQNVVPLAELVRFGAEGYSVDREAIRQLVDAATTGDNRHTPSTVKREARKLKTQARHESWRKEYRALKQRRPELSGVRCSELIASKDIAQGRDAETIRKHMKR
ncbi:MAG: hypothetical protein ABSC62_08085 [Terracidiphilus sp.]